MALLRKEDVAPPAPERPENGALLGRGTRFEGKLAFEGTVRIDGEFYGEIASEGHLVIGESALVDGTVKVGSAVVSGRLKGSVVTTGALDLKAAARVYGELAVDTLVVERGALFEGHVRMTRQT